MQSKRVESIVRAAVIGLMAAAHAACGGGSDREPNPPTATAESELGAAGAQSDSSASAGSMGGDEATTGAAENVEGVTSSQTIADLGLDEFTQMCDEASGVVEVHDSCAGAVSGRGFSYDSDTDQFTEHTCRGFNTCRGFSCVVDA